MGSVLIEFPGGRLTRVTQSNSLRHKSIIFPVIEPPHFHAIFIALLPARVGFRQIADHKLVSDDELDDVKHGVFVDQEIRSP